MSPCRPLIEQGEADLVGDHLDAAGEDDSQVGRVEVGTAQVTDQSLFLQLLEIEEVSR